MAHHPYASGTTTASSNTWILLFLYVLLQRSVSHLILWAHVAVAFRSPLPPPPPRSGIVSQLRRNYNNVDMTTTKIHLHHGYGDYYGKRSITQVPYPTHLPQRQISRRFGTSIGTDTTTTPIDEASRISMELQQGHNNSTYNNINIPKHIAFVCDGNTRWAKQHQQPTLMGHFMGANRTMELIQTIRQIHLSSSSFNSLLSIHHHDITHMTFFAFSTENWNRPMNEIRNLFNILEQTAHYWYNILQHEEQQQQQQQLLGHSNTHNNNSNNRNIIIKFIGDLDDPRIPNSLRMILYKLQEYTSSRFSSTGSISTSDVVTTQQPLTICIAINYGGRQDIVRASQRLMIKLLQEKSNATNASTTNISITEVDVQQYVTEANLQSCFDTHDIPDPDLFIRTSGEVRLSNFLLWNVAYTELYFTNIYWPDFTMDELNNAIVWYSQRKRRFGGSVERGEK
jgi:undecaprenyl diphosphate synthase